MGSFALLHWLIVILMMLVWAYPLSVICRRAGQPAAVGWIAGTIGLFVLGPLWCIGWLALASWKAPALQPYPKRARRRFRPRGQKGGSRQRRRNGGACRG